MELLYAYKRERRRHVAGVAGRSPARRVLVKVESDVWSSDGKIVIRRTTCMDTRDGKVGYYMRKMERWDMRKRRDSAVALTPLLRQLKPHLPDLPADSAQGLAGALITGMVHIHTHLSTRSARSTHLHSFPCSGRRRRGKSELLQQLSHQQRDWSHTGRHGSDTTC